MQSIVKPRLHNHTARVSNFSSSRLHPLQVIRCSASRKNEKNTAPDIQNGQQIDLNIFENAGTSEERGQWEPFNSASSTPGPLTALLSTIDFSEPMSYDGEEKTEYDPLRDGPLRYLGYANELGEAFAAWLFTGGVPLSYAVAIGYVLFDTADKYKKAIEDSRNKLNARNLPKSLDVDALVNIIGAERGIDTLVWQLIASVAAPGYTIHTVVALVTSLLKEIEQQPAVLGALHTASTLVGTSPEVFVETVNKSAPTVAGLLAIPFIVHPIDAGVHALLNATLRPALKTYICNQAGGKEAGLAICRDCDDNK